MALKVFKKFGLKRELNLSDIPNKKLALNNLLDGLSDGITEFTWEDLGVIQNIYLSDLNTGTFSSASGATVKNTQPNGSLKVYDPLITLENRFDKAYFTTSEPFFAGGDGLTANYYDNDAIIRETSGDPTSNFLGFDEEKSIETNNFWERGNFYFSNKFSLQAVSLYGGIEWEGYIKPSIDGNFSLRIRARGYLKVEFDNGTEARDFTYDESTNTFNYNNYDFNELNTLLDQTKLDGNGKINGTSNNITDYRTITISLGSLVQWEAYKIRITWFIDEESIPEGTEIEKRIDINLIDPQSGEIDLNYKKLFTKDYFQNYDIGDFRSFVEYSISVGGTGVGEQGTIGDVQGTFISSTEVPAPADSYANVNNFNPIISYYSFPNSSEEVETVVSGCNVQTNVSTVTISNGQPSSTEGIEIGNFVFGDGIVPGTRVTKVVINTSIEISPRPTGTFPTSSLTFVNHGAISAFGDGEVYDNRVENITNSFGLSDIDTNQILLSSGLSFTYNDDTKGEDDVVATGRLIENYNGSIINLKGSNTSNFIGNQRFYVYQTSGLIDEGLKFFCQDVIKQRLLATQNNISSTSVTLDLDDVSNIVLNDFVHAFPSVNFGERLDGSEKELYSKVRVTNIDNVNNRITISNIDGSSPALLSGLEYNPAKVKNIVFTSTDVNKEVCFKPTDTSPPFAANSTGLTTAFGVSLVDDFSTNGGGNLNNNSTVAYKDLEIRHDVNDAGNVIAYNEENISDYLPIQDDDGNIFYMILGN